MFNFVKNEKGAILTYLVAIVIALISMISALSLTALIRSDSLQKNYQHDLIQEDILLRSEGTRSQLSVEINPNRIIPGREVEIAEGDKRITTYSITNIKSLTNMQNFMGYATQQALKISSEITAKRKRSYGSNPSNQTEKVYGSIESPAIRLTERFLSNQSLSQWQYFTDTEASINEDGGSIDDLAVKFYGPDVLWGPLHSNGDIWIQQAGGGNNSGWPTFYGKVSTSKHFLLYPSGQNLLESAAPLDDIFRSEYYDEADPITFEPTANDLRGGSWLFGSGDFDICYVKMGGTVAEIRKGIITSYIEEINTLSWFPADVDWVEAAVDADFNWFVESDTIMTNYITMYDTTWVEQTIGMGDGSSMFVPSDLWFEGSIAGNQCWGASGDIRLVNNITYLSTTIGEHPDGFTGVDDDDNPTYNGDVNYEDYLGLVSEQKMYIAYKHKDPDTGEVVNNNSISEFGNVYLYGAFAAIAKGDEDIYGIMKGHYDGIFTFEYQHPHGSTPDFGSISPYTGEDTTYTYVDLQKFIYPINNLVPPSIYGFNMHSDTNAGKAFGMDGYPNVSLAYFNSAPNTGPNYVFPQGTDYPWYNPVWPESAEFIATERGTAHIYGSIAQRRRGFMHRSGSDDYNHHPGEYHWNMSTYHFGGDHPSTGYDKDYFYDRRLLYIQPKNFPEVYSGYGNNVLTPFKATNWSFKSPSDN